VILEPMNKVTQFFKNAVSTIFGQDEDEKPHPLAKTYNDPQVKAGIVHLRNVLANSDVQADKDDYSSAFQQIHIKPDMNADEIKEQMDIVLDALYEKNLISPEEQERVNRETLLSSMTQTVIYGIEKGDPNQVLLDSIRFEQELRKPQLQVVDSNIPEIH